MLYHHVYVLKLWSSTIIFVNNIVLTNNDLNTYFNDVFFIIVV